MNQTFENTTTQKIDGKTYTNNIQDNKIIIKEKDKTIIKHYCILTINKNTSIIKTNGTIKTIQNKDPQYHEIIQIFKTKQETQPSTKSENKKKSKTTIKGKKTTNPTPKKIT